MATLTNVPPEIPLPTSTSLLSLLTEPSPEIIRLALSRLLLQVDTTWHEVAESLPLLEEIAEDMEHIYEDDVKSLASAVASRVYFHLEEPRQALRLALTSGSYFAPEERVDAYGMKMTEAAIEAYIRLRQESAAATTTAATTATSTEEEGLDQDKLIALVSSRFETCYAQQRYEEALGVALESREMDRVKEVLNRATQDQVVLNVLEYAVINARGVENKLFRGEALQCVGTVLEQVLKTETTLGGKRRATCLYVKTMQLLNDSTKVGKTLELLLQSSEEEALLGLQLCFDLIDSGDRRFVDQVAACLPQSNDNEAQETTATTATFSQAHRILTSGFTSELHLSFLYKHSQSDPLIMSNLKKSLEERSSGLGGRNSILHNAAVCAHGYLNLGTTGDGFLRDNLEWMKKAANW